MILQCRNHRTRNRDCVASLALAILFTTSLVILQPGAIRAEPVEGATDQNIPSSRFEEMGAGWLPFAPHDITAGVDMGYDDNATISANAEGSSFARENVVLTYDRPGQRTQFYVLGIGRFTQYFDVTGQNDMNGNVTMALTHNFSTRASFYASVYGSYQTEPNFRSNVGPENVRSPFFDTVDIFSLTYHWVLRFTTVTSYTLERVQYTSSSVGTSQNRAQSTLGEKFQFSLTSRTLLVGEYRFETIDYDTASMNSMTHILLAGINHNLTEHLIVSVRAGESFRSLENDGNTASPYFESSLGYVSSNHSLKWMTSYGFESPTSAGVSVTKTWRTGLDLTYGLTSRISSTAGVYYHHDEDQGVGTQDSLQLILGLRYTINKRFALHVDYEHESIGSLGSTPGYSRNRYSAGLTYTY